MKINKKTQRRIRIATKAVYVLSCILACASFVLPWIVYAETGDRMKSLFSIVAIIVSCLFARYMSEINDICNK